MAVRYPEVRGLTAGGAGPRVHPLALRPEQGEHLGRPPEGRFDLVTAHYLHSRGPDRAALFGRLAEDVAAVLDPALWHDVLTGVRDRAPEAVARTGNPAPDTVLRARRATSGAR